MSQVSARRSPSDLGKFNSAVLPARLPAQAEGRDESIDGQGLSGFAVVKRLSDLAIALVLLVPVSLICLVVACLNPFLNPGRLFFTQIRIGRDEMPFRIIKLRTMVDDGTVASLDTDEKHRITRFGAFLRSKRIDELPQILNILMGHMSFIGPRPEQRELYEEILEMIPEYHTRQVVRPGISGLAQVQSGYAREASELRTKLRYDMHYIRNMGLRMDLYVLFQTARVIITGFGAR